MIASTGSACGRAARVGHPTWCRCSVDHVTADLHDGRHHRDPVATVDQLARPGDALARSRFEPTDVKAFAPRSGLMPGDDDAGETRVPGADCRVRSKEESHRGEIVLVSDENR